MAVNMTPALYFDVGIVPIKDPWVREIRRIETAIGGPLRDTIDPEENDCEEAGTEREQAVRALAAGIPWDDIARSLGAKWWAIHAASKEGL